MSGLRGGPRGDSEGARRRARRNYAEATAEAEERVDEDAASVETKDVRAAPGEDGEGLGAERRVRSRPSPSPPPPRRLKRRRSVRPSRVVLARRESTRASVDAQHASSSRGAGGRARLAANSRRSRRLCARAWRRTRGGANPPRRSSTGCRRNFACSRRIRLWASSWTPPRRNSSRGYGASSRGYEGNKRMLAAQAAADALQQKLALLETDLGAFSARPSDPKIRTPPSRDPARGATSRRVSSRVRRASEPNRRAKKKTRTKCRNPPPPRPRGGTRRTVSRTCPRTRREVL